MDGAAASWAAVMGGMIVPAITSFLKRHEWPTKVKYVFMIAISFVGAVAAQLLSGGVHLNQPIQFFGEMAIVVATAQTTYRLFFEGTKVEAALADKQILPATLSLKK